MRNGGNYFACEERNQPFFRPLAHDLALGRQQRLVQQLFREREQPDLTRPRRRDWKRSERVRFERLEQVRFKQRLAGS